MGVFDPRDQSVDDGHQNERVKLDRILFSQGSNVISPGLVFCVASAKGGELGIGLTWQEDVVVKEDAEKVLKELEAELRGLAKDDEDTTHNAISMTADK